MREEVRTVRFDFLGEKEWATYRLGALGPDLSDWQREHGADQGAFRDLIEKLLTAWSVTDDDGTPIPPTRAAIEEHGIPTPFLTAARDAVYEDAAPNAIARATSGGPSSRPPATA